MILNKAEQQFFDLKKSEGKTLLNPIWFYFKNGTIKYHPDFYCPEEGIVYEIVGTRQAYHSNKHKYILMSKEYPEVTFKIVNPDGSPWIIKKIRKIIEKLFCKRCGHNWIPRNIEIRMCPKCKSPWWDIKKIQPVK